MEKREREKGNGTVALNEGILDYLLFIFVLFLFFL